MEELKRANDRLNNGIADEIRKLGLKIQQDLSSIQGEYFDEVSLLTQVSGRYFQSIPEFNTLYETSKSNELYIEIKPAQLTLVNASCALYL